MKTPKQGQREGHGFSFLLVRRFRKFSSSFVKRKNKLSDTLAALFFSARARVVPRKPSTLFIGYCEAELGLGVSFRSLLTALDRARVRFAIYPFNRNVETRRIGPFLESHYDLDGVYDINVVYVAADESAFILRHLSKQVSGAGYNILRTYWELPLAPAAWAPLLERFDELWVPNAFVADAFRPIFKGNIATIPVYVDVDRSANYDRRYFGLADGYFHFLFSFDYYSGTARKNPLAVAQAFSYAFPDPQTKVRLILKSVGPEEIDPIVVRTLAAFAAVDDRIRIIDRSMTRDEILSLMDVCDCYVSLHRSEGFGMGMAESLALAKPVIGTDFSGNRDFLSSETGFPVPYQLRRLIPREYPMGDGESWAEPDLREAIRLMRLVFEDRPEGRRRAALGQSYMAAQHSAEAVTRYVEKRLEEIRELKGFARPE